MEKKNTLLLTVIAVATLLVAVVGATFAYFGSFNQEVNQTANINLTTTAGLTSSFVTTSKEYEFSVPDSAMGFSNVDNRVNVADGTATLTVTLNSGSDETTTECTYDVLFTGKGNYTENKSTYETAKTGGDEFTYTLGNDEGTGYTVGTARTLFTETEANFSALDGLKDAKVSTGDKLVSTGKDATVTYSLNVKFYNLPNVAQTGLQSKTFGGILKVANQSCTSKKVGA